MTESRSISVVESAMTNCQQRRGGVVRWDAAGLGRKGDVKGEIMDERFNDFVLVVRV